MSSSTASSRGLSSSGEELLRGLTANRRLWGSGGMLRGDSLRDHKPGVIMSGCKIWPQSRMLAWGVTHSLLIPPTAASQRCVVKQCLAPCLVLPHVYQRLH